MAELTYKDTYTSFTGVDMTASVLGVPIGSLLSISYSIQREKAGIYTCGSPDPRSVSRGKRGIAGSLIFQIFDRDALYQVMYHHKDDFKFWTRNSNVQTIKDQYGPDPNNWINDWKAQSLGFNSYTPFYADQMPPFDITLSFLNEVGNMARLDIYGVELLNEGMGISIEDMAIEQAMTFIARAIGKINPSANAEEVAYVNSYTWPV